MLVFLIILILLLSLLATPLRVGMHFYLNLFGNDGFIKIYFFGIRVFMAGVHFEHESTRHNNLVIDRKGKSDKIHLNTDPTDKKSVAAMMKHPALKNMLVEKISAHFIAGKTNDAFFTVALMQALRVLFYATLAPIKCRYSVQITESFTPVYNNDVLQTDFIGIISISIADIIMGYIQNGAKKKTRNNQEVASV